MNDLSPPRLSLSHPLIIMAAALLIRSIWAALVPADPISDGALYDAFARSIASGHGYAFPDGTMTEYWPVGTSAVYSLLYRAFGVAPWTVPAFQALLGAVIVGLTWQIAQSIFGSRVAVVAAWLTAFWPLLIEFTTIYASELLFIVPVMASISIWISRRIPFAIRMLCFGATVALATYVRPTALPLLLLFPSIQWVIDRDWKALIKGVALAVAAAALLFAPWSIRSVELFGKFALVSANGGVNLWMGNNPDSTGGYMDLPDTSFANEVDRDHYYGSEALRFIRTHPFRYAKLSAGRAITTYDRETIGIVWNEKGLRSKYPADALTWLKRASSAYWLALLILGIAGLLSVLRRRVLLQAWPVVAAFAYLGIFPILTVAMDRYHVPIDPLLAMLAACTLCGRPFFLNEPPGHGGPLVSDPNGGTGAR
jgi:hypothetical protein